MKRHAVIDARARIPPSNARGNRIRCTSRRSADVPLHDRCQAKGAFALSPTDRTAVMGLALECPTGRYGRELYERRIDRDLKRRRRRGPTILGAHEWLRWDERFDRTARLQRHVLDDV